MWDQNFKKLQQMDADKQYRVNNPNPNNQELRFEWEVAACLHRKIKLCNLRLPKI